MGQAQSKLNLHERGYEEDVSSARIKSDIDQTRREMDETIDELGERLRPQHLVDDLICYLKGGNGNGSGAGDIGRVLMRQVRENPVPSLLIGAGLAWMALDRNKRRDEELYIVDYDPDMYGYEYDIEPEGEYVPSEGEYVVYEYSADIVEQPEGLGECAGSRR